MSETITLVSKDGKTEAEIPAHDKAEITNKRATGWRTPAEHAATTAPADHGDPVPYSDWRVVELQAEIDKRNTDRDPEGDDYVHIEPPGNKAELVAALEGDDAR